MKLLTKKLVQAFSLIPLPGVLPARTPSKIPRTFPRIKSELDLPPYLVFGELQKQSFKLRDHSWSATWGANPHSGQLQCKYDARKSSMVLSATWRGLRGPIHAGKIDSPAAFRQAVIRLFTALKDYEIPLNWKDKLLRELGETKSSVEYLGNLDTPTASGFPDGPLCTYCCPIGVADLVKLQETLEKGGSLLPENLSTPCAVMAVPALVRSIYPVEYESDEDELREMFESGLRDMGGLPLEFPSVAAATPAGSEEEEPALVIHLLSYVLVSITPFAGLFDVINAWESSLPGPMIRLPQRTPFVVTATPPFFRKPWVGLSGASTEWTLPAHNDLVPILEALSAAPSAGEAIARIKDVRKFAAKFTTVAEKFLDEEQDD